MANIDRFISHFAKHNEFSKTSKFEVYILGAPIAGAEGLRFQCETSELPGYNINTVEGLVYGAKYAIAATPVYNELNLTFICAGDLWEKKFFDAWLEYILPQTDYTARYRDEYMSMVRVTAFNEQGNPAHQVEFLEAFPNTTSAIQLNWGDDGINRLSVGFKYRKWRQIPINGVSIPLLGTSIIPQISLAPSITSPLQITLGDGGFIKL